MAAALPRSRSTRAQPRPATLRVGRTRTRNAPEVAPQCLGARLPGHRRPPGDVCLCAALKAGDSEGKGGRASGARVSPGPRGGRGLASRLGCRAARSNARPGKLGGLRGYFASGSWTASVCVLAFPCNLPQAPYSLLSLQALLTRQTLRTTPDHVSVVAWRR